MAQRKKITELYIEREVTRHKKDASGKRIPYKKTVKAVRPVETVGQGARFGHYFIDSMVVLGVYVAVSFVLSGNFGFENEVFESNSGGFRISLKSAYNIPNIAISFLFYFLMETFTGQTLGKMVTGTVVINQYGEKPDAGMVAIRSIARWVPFEAFSCLSGSGRGWHDKWSNTFVVPKQEAEKLRQLIATGSEANSATHYPEFEYEGNQGAEASQQESPSSPFKD